MGSPEPLDPAVVRLLIDNALPKVRAWRGRHSEPATAPAVGSDLHLDDQLSSTYSVTQGAYYALFMATDNLEGVSKAILHRDSAGAYTVTTTPHAPFTLMRAVVEGAATAVWLTSPDDTRVRIARRLQLALSDAQHEDTAAKNFGSRDTAKFKKVHARVVDVAKVNRLPHFPKNGRLSTKTIISEAAPLFAVRHLLGYWNVLSGASHGDWWVSSVLLERTILSDLPGDLRAVSITAPADRTVTLFLLATAFLEEAWAMYDQRAAPPTS